MDKLTRTVYIAGPMTGKPNYNIDNFDRVAKRLREEGFNVLNPGEFPLIEGWTYKEYWPFNKAMLRGCDTIYMLKGWEDSPGARNEHEFAMLNRCKVIYEL